MFPWLIIQMKHNPQCLWEDKGYNEWNLKEISVRKWEAGREAEPA